MWESTMNNDVKKSLHYCWILIKSLLILIILSRIRLSTNKWATANDFIVNNFASYKYF